MPKKKVCSRCNGDRVVKVIVYVRGVLRTITVACPLCGKKKKRTYEGARRR